MLRFGVHGTYTHKRMLDLAIYVLKAFTLGDGRVSLKVKWLNRRGMSLNITERIMISKEERKNWYPINVWSKND